MSRATFAVSASARINTAESSDSVHGTALHPSQCCSSSSRLLRLCLTAARTRTASPAFESRRALLEERAQTFLNIRGRVRDHHRQRGVAQRVFKTEIEGAAHHRFCEAHRQRARVASACAKASVRASSASSATASVTRPSCSAVCASYTSLSSVILSDRRAVLDRDRGGRIRRLAAASLRGCACTCRTGGLCARRGAVGTRRIVEPRVFDLHVVSAAQLPRRESAGVAPDDQVARRAIGYWIVDCSRDESVIHLSPTLAGAVATTRDQTCSSQRRDAKLREQAKITIA